jgi:hypothetical protein
MENQSARLLQVSCSDVLNQSLREAGLAMVEVDASGSVAGMG